MSWGMRQLLDKHLLENVMQAIGQQTTGPGTVYLVGGSSAVWFGWRQSTVDLDIALAPEPAGLFGAMEQLKRDLNLSIELASPGQFVPSLPGWQGRSEYVLRAGQVDFYHYDFYSQAFAKLNRSHKRDLNDVEAMFKAGKIVPQQLLTWVDAVLPETQHYPSIDPIALRARVADWVKMHA